MSPVLPAEPASPTARRLPVLGHLSRTFSLNAVTIGLKTLATLLWGWLDNPALLGRYGLMCLPAAFMSRGMAATSIAQARIPSLDVRAETTLLKTTTLVDASLMGLVAVVITAFFVFTRAPILENLGHTTYFAVLAVGLVECVCSVAFASSVARRRYRWTFAITSGRTLCLISMLFLLSRSGHTEVSAALGFGLACLPPLCSAAVAGGYLAKHVRGFWTAPIHRGFIRELLGQAHEFSAYKLGMLAYGSMPGLLLAYTEDSHRIGLLAFAFTLSNFVFQATMPAVEQVFAPTIGYHASRPGETREVRATVLQMSLVATTGAIVASIVLYFTIGTALGWLGKTQFLASTRWLPFFLVYQVCVIASQAPCHAIFGLRRYFQLATIYWGAAGAAAIWMYFARGTEASVPGAFAVLGSTTLALAAVFCADSLRTPPPPETS